MTARFTPDAIPFKDIAATGLMALVVGNLVFLDAEGRPGGGLRLV